MMRYAWTRILYEKRWFVAGWSVIYSVITTLILMFYPSFGQNGGFAQVAQTLPTQLQGFVGDPAAFSTLEGFITTQVYDIRMSLLLIVAATALALSLTVSEEGNGDTRTILATPMSRDRLAFEKLLAATMILAFLNLVSTAGVYAGIAALGETAPHIFIWQLYALSVLFAVVMFCIPFAIGLSSGSRALTMSLSLTIAIGGYLLSTFARAVDWLEAWEPLSLIYYYDTAGLREGSFINLDIWVLGCVALFSIAIGIVLFRRRDIA